MSRPLRRTLATLFAMALATIGLVLAVPASATSPASAPTITPLADGPLVQANGFAVTGSLGGTSCDAAIDSAAVVYTLNGTPTTAIDRGTTTANSFDFLIPAGLRSTPGVEDILGMSLTCNVASTPTTFTGQLVWAEFAVTKVVTGDAPAGAKFTVTASCTWTEVLSVSPGSVSPAAAQEFTFNLAAGESGSVMAFTDATCTFAETDAGGATSSEILPAGPQTVLASHLYPVTVTNTFPAATPKYTG